MTATVTVEQVVLVLTQLDGTPANDYRAELDALGIELKKQGVDLRALEQLILRRLHGRVRRRARSSLARNVRASTEAMASTPAVAQAPLCDAGKLDVRYATERRRVGCHPRPARADRGAPPSALQRGRRWKLCMGGPGTESRSPQMLAANEANRSGRDRADRHDQGCDTPSNCNLRLTTPCTD